MPTHKVISMIDGQPTFSVAMPVILGELESGGALKTLSPLEYHTDQQRKWYRGVCLKGLSDWNGDTVGEWDARLKYLCGADLLKRENIYIGDGTGGCVIRLSIQGVGKKNMTAYIENILSRAITMDWPVTPPDSELRR